MNFDYKLLAMCVIACAGILSPHPGSGFCAFMIIVVLAG